MANKIKIRKRLPYYIVERYDKTHGDKFYRLHDIFYHYCWCNSSSIEELLHSAVLKCITEPDTLSVYGNLMDMSHSPGMERFLHRESWLEKLKKDNKPIPWDYYQEYEELLNNSGEYSNKYYDYTLYPEEYIRESIEEYREKLHSINKWTNAKLKSINKTRRVANKFKDLLLSARFDTIKASQKNITNKDRRDIKSLIKNLNK